MNIPPVSTLPRTKDLMNEVTSMWTPGGIEVLARRYTNPDGSIGGFVANLEKIGADVWIDARAFILPGVEIPPQTIISGPRIIDENSL
ncbi:MAG: hypothetical protein AAGA39_00790 [Pseudomonadota bacterium]